jgi:hypothetical protein
MSLNSLWRGDRATCFDVVAGRVRFLPVVRANHRTRAELGAARAALPSVNNIQDAASS